MITIKKYQKEIHKMNAKSQYFMSIAGLLMLAFMMMPTLQVSTFNNTELQEYYGVPNSLIDLEALIKIKISVQALIMFFFITYLSINSVIDRGGKWDRILVSSYPFFVMFLLTSLNIAKLVIMPWLETYLLALASVFSLIVISFTRVAILALLCLGMMLTAVKLLPLSQSVQFNLIINVITFTILFCMLASAHLYNVLRRLEVKDDLNQKNIELSAMNKSLRRISSTDSVTGIPNRRQFDAYSDQVSRMNQTMALILLDIDFFKEYNDLYGHQEGDECLKRVASTLSSSLQRDGDMVFRYGGEEFVIVLPNTELSGAICTAERLRREIEKLGIEHIRRRDNLKVVTVSLGVSCSSDKDNVDVTKMINKADHNMYRAKELGRNQIHSKL